MAAFSKIDVKDKDLLASLQGFLKRLLESDKIDALMVPWHLPMISNVMSTLIMDPETIDNADPLAPCFPINAAKMASKLTKKRSGQAVGLVMRPCEIRAFVELIKLKQGTLDDIVIISLDCLGAFGNTDYNSFAKEDPMGSTRKFYEHVLEKKSEAIEGVDLASACKVCEHPVSKNADINIGLYGMDYKSHLIVEAQTPKGEDVIATLSLEDTSEPSSRKQAIDSLVSDRTARRDDMFETVLKTTFNIEKLSTYLAKCVNCYNCRVACPVCYCKECVFVTDVFDHDAFQYLQWAKRKGKIKMPADTDFFHLTRMAHIGLTCVGCGQCSNACPNDIPLMELFRTIAHHAQKEFDYEAGRSVDEPIPLSVFDDKEFEEVVGTSS
jgi:formate dehydrogenase (coenzyme F420) beta subunit